MMMSTLSVAVEVVVALVLLPVVMSHRLAVELMKLVEIGPQKNITTNNSMINPKETQLAVVHFKQL